MSVKFSAVQFCRFVHAVRPKLRDYALMSATLEEKKNFARLPLKKQSIRCVHFVSS